MQCIGEEDHADPNDALLSCCETAIIYKFFIFNSQNVDLRVRVLEMRWMFIRYLALSGPILIYLIGEKKTYLLTV